MMTRRTLLALGALTVASPALAQAKAAVYPNPLAAVKAVYDPKVKDAQRPYSKSLRALYAAAQKKSRQLNEVVAGLDFDPTISAQDNDENFRNTLHFSVEPRPNRNAVVTARLRVFKDAPETRIVYELSPEGEGYVIDDIVNPDPKEGWRWSKLLALGAKGQ